MDQGKKTGITFEGGFLLVAQLPIGLLLIQASLQPGLIKIRTSGHLLCDTVLCTLQHAPPQFQREMSTKWR